MRCVLCAAPPPPPQTLFLSTFVCCAKKTNTPVDFFFLLKFYTRKSKKMSAFFSCVHSSNVIKKMTRMTKFGWWSFTHTTKISLVLAFYVPGWYFWNLCPPAFIHSFIHSFIGRVGCSFKLVSSLSTQHAQYAHARRKGVIK